MLIDEKDDIWEKETEGSGFEINDENVFKKEKDKGRSKNILQSAEEVRGKKRRIEVQETTDSMSES